MSDATVSNLSNALKTRYPQQKITEQFYTDCPLLGMIPKKTDLTGKNWVVAVRTAGQNGVSPDFATAQANRTSSAQSAFTVTYYKEYGVGRIDGDLIDLGKGSEGSLVLDAMESEMDTLMIAMKRALCVGVWGDGSGKLGQVSSVTAATNGVITLTNREDIINFEIGQTIFSNVSLTAAGTLSSTGGVVSAVSPADKKVTFTGTMGGGGNDVAANHYLFQAGSFGAKMKGVQAWTPITAPAAAESFFGVDRSTHFRLGGLRFTDGAGGAIVDTLLKTASYCAVFEANPKDWFMNPTDWTKLEIALENKVIYDKSKAFDMPTIGYDAIALQTGYGKVKIHADPSCPPGYVFALTLSDYLFHTTRKAPHILDKDGNRIRAVSNADTYEWRLGWYGTTYNKAPGRSCVATL